MCLKIFEVIFILVSLILAFLLIAREIGITKYMSPMRASDYVSSMAVFMLGYILISFVIAVFAQGIFNKMIFLFFCASPFIIGKFVTYKRLKIFSVLQILCVIISLGYVIVL